MVRAIKCDQCHGFPALYELGRDKHPKCETCGLEMDYLVHNGSEEVEPEMLAVWFCRGDHGAKPMIPAPHPRDCWRTCVKTAHLRKENNRPHRAVE